MKNKCIPLCLALVLASSNTAIAQVDYYSGYQQPPAPPTTGMLLTSALVSGISTALVAGVGGGLTVIIGGLFNKLANRMFGEPTNQQGFNQSNGNQQYANQQAQQGTQNLQVNNNITPTPTGNITPAIAYKIEQLNPSTYAAIRTFENLKDNTPSLNTGDVFSITYEPNMPGQVRLENIDSQNVITPLGTYNVVGRKSLRLPKTKGFQLSGAPGTEQINIYFTPCRPPEALNQAGVVEFGVLPVCSNTQETSLAKAGKAGGIRPKAVLNLESPDPSIAVGVTPDYTRDDLQNGQPVKQEIKIFHQGLVQQQPTTNAGEVNGTL